LSPEAASRLALPADRSAYLVTADREQSSGPRREATTELSELRFRPRSRLAPRSIEGRLPRRAVRVAVRGADLLPGASFDSAGLLSVPSPRRPGCWAPPARHGGRSGTSRWGLEWRRRWRRPCSGAWPSAPGHDFDNTDLMRPAAEAKARYELYGNTGLITLGVAVALGVGGGALLWPWGPAAQAEPVPPVTP